MRKVVRMNLLPLLESVSAGKKHQAKARVPSQAVIHPTTQGETHPQSIRERERQNSKWAEINTHYLPSLKRLDDKSLLCEIFHWRRECGKKARTFPWGDYDANYFKSLEALYRRALRFDGWELSVSKRAILEKDCITIRSRVVPEGETPIRPRRAPEVIQRFRQQSLWPNSDWELLQMLASRVGSIKMETYEIVFIAENWRLAYQIGRNYFFSTVGERSGAEKLWVSFFDRSTELCLDQIELFRSRAGDSFRVVPLWQVNPKQNLLPTLESVRIPPPDDESKEDTESPTEHLNFLDKLEPGYWKGQAEQLAMIELERRPWDGDADQFELSFK